MNLAEPAPSVEPATAEMAVAPKSVDDDDEYKVEVARESSDHYVVESVKVEPAVLDDPKKFAPHKQLNEKYGNADLDVSLEKLRSGLTGLAFEGPAAVCTGLQMTCTRLVLGPILPCLYDERDFISFGEISRYVAVKDGYCFVYGQKSDLNPLYHIPIESFLAVKEDPKKPHKKSRTVSPRPNTNLSSEALETVLLVDSMNALAYQLTFEVNLDKDIANNFIQAVGDANLNGKSKEKAIEAKQKGDKIV